MVTALQSRLIDAQLAPAALNSAISTAIAAKSLDAQRQEGAAVLQLLDQALLVSDSVAPPQTGQLLDLQA
jgi:hypothetical protein